MVTLVYKSKGSNIEISKDFDNRADCNDFIASCEELDYVVRIQSNGSAAYSRLFG